jgi:hypothetical protein
MPEPTAPTISVEHATALHEGTDGTTAGPWTRVGEYHYDTGRWTERWWLVVADPDGALWGARYEIGLTECQESAYPWYGDRAHPAPLTRLYAHEVVRVEYRRTPPEGGDGRG